MTNRKEVRPLQVGERCRVYEGPDVVDGEVIPLPDESYPGAVNVLLDPDSDGYIRQQMFHKRQCVRLTKKPRPKPQERKIHWINMCNSSGCEIQLFDQRYTIWLSNKDWKQAERDGEFLIAALESIGLPEAK